MLNHFVVGVVARIVLAPRFSCLHAASAERRPGARDGRIVLPAMINELPELIQTLLSSLLVARRSELINCDSAQPQEEDNPPSPPPPNLELLSLSPSLAKSMLLNARRAARVRELPPQPIKPVGWPAACKYLTTSNTMQDTRRAETRRINSRRVELGIKEVSARLGAAGNSIPLPLFAPLQVRAAAAQDLFVRRRADNTCGETYQVAPMLLLLITMMNSDWLFLNCAGPPVMQLATMSKQKSSRFA